MHGPRGACNDAPPGMDGPRECLCRGVAGEEADIWRKFNTLCNVRSKAATLTFSSRICDLFLADAIRIQVEKYLVFALSLGNDQWDLTVVRQSLAY